MTGKTRARIVTKRGYTFEGVAHYDRGCVVVNEDEAQDGHIIVVPWSSIDHYSSQKVPA